MRLLFVCSGNSGMSPIVKAQAQSLISAGVPIDFFLIKGKGVVGYIKSIFALSCFIRKKEIDIVHAHYSLSGFVSAIATRKPIVCSLMGSDVNQFGLVRVIIRFFVKHIWGKTIVKSVDMSRKLNSLNVEIVPNGVDLDMFMPMDKAACRDRLKWDTNKRVILFAANPNRSEKNYALASRAVEEIKLEDIIFICEHKIKHEEIPFYLNACDILLLTSKWEGSPNIVKEAMACNIPIVSTDVGDVRHLLDNLEGCYITSQEPHDVAAKLHSALHFKKPTQGRARLVGLGLDSICVAKRISDIYQSLLQ